MSNSISFRSVVWWRGQAFDLIWWQTYQGLSQRTWLEEKPARLPSRTQSGKVRRPQDQAYRSNCNIERNAQLGGTINIFQCTYFSKVRSPVLFFLREEGKECESIPIKQIAFQSTYVGQLRTTNTTKLTCAVLSHSYSRVQVIKCIHGKMNFNNSWKFW